MIKGVKIFLFVILAALIFNENLWSYKVQSNISRGKYIPSSNIDITDLRNMPVPATNEDYALLQSLDNECNIVIGKFKEGHREIILFKDRNSDGKIDLVAHWFVDRKRFKFVSNPGNFYPPEAFKKMKDDIINGRGGEIIIGKKRGKGKKVKITPNPEGVGYFRELLKDYENIRRWKSGYMISKMDPDSSVDRVSFSVSNNGVHGVDMVFEVKYHFLGQSRVSPVINFSVYCRNSKDGHIAELVKQLLKEVRE